MPSWPLGLVGGQMRSVQDEGTKVSSRRHPPAAQNIDLEAGALAAKLLYTASARDMPHRRSEISSPWGIRKGNR